MFLTASLVSAQLAASLSTIFPRSPNQRALSLG